MKHSNGTPVYHIVAEPYSKLFECHIYMIQTIITTYFSKGILPFFLVFVPHMMQARFFALWDRLVESGIDAHVNDQIIALYKTIRYEWSKSSVGEPHLAVEDTDGNGTADGFNGQLMLLMLVFGFGNGFAGLVFGMELLWDKFGRHTTVEQIKTSIKKLMKFWYYFSNFLINWTIFSNPFLIY